MNQIENEISIVDIIQAMWLIDEKAMIFRNLIWLNPINVLIINENKIIIIKKFEFNLLFIIKIIGAIFCHVNKIKEFIQFKPSITSGNQKWKGAAPNLVSNAEFIIIIKVELIFREINSIFNNIIIIENNKINEAKAWVIKYFNDDSDENILLTELNKGIIDNKLISNPIHIPIQEYEEIEIKVPIIIELKKIILYNFIIKKRKIKTFMVRVWT